MTERLRIGVAGLEGRWSSEALADAVAALTGSRLLIDLRAVTLDLAAGRASYGDVDLCSLHGLLVKKLGAEHDHHLRERLSLLRYLEARGVRVFSEPERTSRLIDRVSCTVTLAAHGLPMPPTTITEDVGRAARAVQAYGEAVLKPLYSSKAQGMQLVRAEDAALERALAGFKARGNPVLYLQRRLALGERDYGVVFLGGEHVGTYARVRGASAWSTSTLEGGRYAAHDAPPALVELARRAQAPFGLDLASVDVIEHAGGLAVLEVSAFGGFSGCRALGIDLAARYARYAVERLTR